jgi:hypothetical protein
MPSSRYVRRPLAGERLVLTVRDLEILGRVHSHRFMRAEHLHPLCFRGRTLRVTQARLAKLWQHGYLDRHFVPYALDGTRRAPSEAATPVYALGERGLETLRKAAGEPNFLGGAARSREFSPVTLAHRLIVTDLLASLEAAALEKGIAGQVAVEHEWWLWKKAAERQTSTHGLAVPDGAFTLRGPERSEPETWYVEIARAGVSGGNETLLAKMRRYLSLRAEGRFHRAFGHGRIRGVLIAAPTPERARNLRALAARLPSGSRFFAFTHYEDRRGDRRLRRFRPETVLELGWTDGAGGIVRIGHSGERDAPGRPSS